MPTKRKKFETGDYTMLTFFGEASNPMEIKGAIGQVGVAISTASGRAWGGNVRLCRTKTEQELGYKLVVDSSDDTVKFINLDEALSATQTILPVGLERGVALRYANRQHRLVLRSWSKIKAEANELRSDCILTIDDN